MPTANVPLNKTWTQLAADTDENLLVTFHGDATLEFATTASDDPPVVDGHRLTKDDAITRSVIGPGYVWARTVGSLRPNTATLVVSK